MRHVVENRVSEPTPQNRVSVLFVLSFIAVLAVIGAAAWLFLNTVQEIPVGGATASTKIDGVVVAEKPTAAPASNVAEDISKALAATAEQPSKELEVAEAIPKTKMLVIEDILLPKETADTEKARPEPVEPASIIAETPAKAISDIAPASGGNPVGDASKIVQPKITEIVVGENTEPVSPDTKPEAIAEISEEAEAQTLAATTQAEPLQEEGVADVAAKNDLTEQTVSDQPETPAAEETTDAKIVITPSEPIVVATIMPDDVTATTSQPTQEKAEVAETPPVVVEPEKASAPQTETVKVPVDEVIPAPVEKKATDALEAREEAAEALEPVDVAVVVPPASQPEKAASVEPELPLWKKNARPFEAAADQPRIAFVISDLGMSKTRTAAAIAGLPPVITLAFNPYSRTLTEWVTKAREAGHEVLLQLPMEPVGYPKIDPGPRALLTNLSVDENKERLDWILARTDGYVGITNQMGSKFTASRDHIEPVLGVIKDRGLLYLDSRTASNSVGAKVASEHKVPVTFNNRFLDNRVDDATFALRLSELERIAREKGVAVGIGYPHPATIERLTKWADSLPEKGIILAPISAVVDRQDIK